DLSGGRDSVSRVGYDADTAFFGRLGARLVRTWLAAGDRPVTLSGRFNVWHDFDQGATTRIATPNGGHAVDLRASLGGTWGQAQVMAASQITASLSAFVSGDYNFSLDGSDAKGFGGRVGFRLRF